MNLKNKEILVKIVYYGPDRSGKTANLEYIYDRYKHRVSPDKVMVKKLGDRTLLLDFLPLEVGKIKDYNVRVQFYTVPGHLKNNATRKLVLKGADGIVFVADSMVVRREKNILSFRDLQKNLSAHGKDISKTPLVFQYNKRDLKEQGIPLLPVETLEKDLNNRIKAPYFEASALTGANVLPTMRKVISLTLSSVQKEFE
ncbi:MAG: gliding motility protein [Deltaproteobacteria bacterium]|nr:GTPase domain-containing protein [Deltaproteobacteria bacterium]MBW2077973.1 GTPase domain-containing protein [Deltaproteobacteria bacterium]RLB29649.1 MAG: gliding motility protein [Deltaproteobacteria bacterium]